MRQPCARHQDVTPHGEPLSARRNSGSEFTQHFSALRIHFSDLVEHALNLGKHPSASVEPISPSIQASSVLIEAGTGSSKRHSGFSQAISGFNKPPSDQSKHPPDHRKHRNTSVEEPSTLSKHRFHSTESNPALDKASSITRTLLKVQTDTPPERCDRFAERARPGRRNVRRDDSFIGFQSVLMAEHRCERRFSHRFRTAAD